MLNEIKSNLRSSLIYLREYILFLLIVIITFYFLSERNLNLLFAYILLAISGLIILFQMGKGRNKELGQIKVIINNITTNKYSSTDEIVLTKNLDSLEKEIKQMYQKSKNDIEYLNKLQKMRSQFIANVSHELRTPIFTIQGYIETLLEGAIDDTNVNKKFLRKANQHTIALSNLLNDLIDLSMIESGELRMSYRYFNVNKYLGGIVEEIVPLVEENDLEIIYHPARDDLEILGDKEKLKQVFVNIIQNAIKYTKKGSVEVFVEEDKKSVKFIVKDTGIGIPEKSVGRIFERFYRVDKTRSRSVGGTGLGLAIVKHILEAHNSTIEVKSVLNKGSEFSFELNK
ncbi:MAG: ATP-binding protein [Bacteroidetes bacterium]|nr:ATP-binding protein [Bacteroidota bacterium]